MVSTDFQHMLTIYVVLGLFVTIAARSTDQFTSVGEDMYDRFIKFNTTSSESSPPINLNATFLEKIFNSSSTFQAVAGLVSPYIEGITFLFELGGYVIDVAFSPISIMLASKIPWEVSVIVGGGLSMMFIIAGLGFVFNR